MAASFDDKKDIEAAGRSPSPDHAKGVITDIGKQDAALDFLRSGGDVAPMSPSDEKALIRKIDYRIMPLMFFAYGV